MIIVEPKAELLAYTQLVPRRTYRHEDVHLNLDVKLVDQDPCSEPARVIERCGRISWKSEDKMTRGSADGFMTRVVHIKKDESIAEHASATIVLTLDRYASHQLVRHRIGSYTQESTHYINYTKKGRELQVCRPLGIEVGSEAYELWKENAARDEETYFRIIDLGVKHYHARFAAPSCLKTEVAVTYNFRIWPYFLGLRTTAGNTPEIVLAAKMCGDILANLCPELFGKWRSTGQTQTTSA
jgi:thymidylate synthase (FAD)